MFMEGSTISAAGSIGCTTDLVQVFSCFVRQYMWVCRCEDQGDEHWNMRTKRRVLLQRLKEIEQSKKQPAFRFGEICYGTGEYAKACLAFQVAVKDAGSETVAGGEASLWLALCFQVAFLGILHT